MNTILGGLPAHPLVIHLASVAAPVAALLAIAWAVSTHRFTRSRRIAAVATSAVAAVSMLAARSTGEALLHPMGLSEGNLGAVSRHAQLADASTIAAFVLFVAVAAFYAVCSDRLAARTPHWAPLALRGAVVLAGAATLVTVILVGHAGAQLAWADFPRS